MTTPRRLERQIRFLRNRLSPEGALGLHLTLGLMIMICGCWIFAGIAADIRPDESLVAVDLRVTNWFHSNATPGLTTVARLATTFGSVAFVTAASVIGLLLFLRTHAWDRLLAFALTMLGGSALNIILKHLFHRQRPVLENPLVTLSSFGFPSGHTMGATLLYGFLALLAAQSFKTWRERMSVSLGAGLMIVAVGLSRIYLGAHYLSDVLAAMAAAAAWLALCWTTVEVFRKRRRHIT